MPIPVFFFFNETATTAIYTLSLHDALPIFLTLMRPSLVLFLVLWLKLVKDFLKVRCRLALLQRTFKKSLDRKSGSAGMPRPISYAVFCLKKKKFGFPNTSWCYCHDPDQPSHAQSSTRK